MYLPLVHYLCMIVLYGFESFIYLQKVDNANAEKCAKVWSNQLTAQQPKNSSHVQKVAQQNFSPSNYFMNVPGLRADKKIIILFERL